MNYRNLILPIGIAVFVAASIGTYENDYAILVSLRGVPLYGLVGIQPVIAAGWSVLGPYRFIVRLPISICWLYLIAYTYFLASTKDMIKSSPPLESEIAVENIIGTHSIREVAMAYLAAVPLFYVLTRLLKVHLQNCPQGEQKPTRTRLQFGTLDLMILTIGVSILLTMVNKFPMRFDLVPAIDGLNRSMNWLPLIGISVAATPLLVTSLLKRNVVKAVSFAVGFYFSMQMVEGYANTLIRGLEYSYEWNLLGRVAPLFFIAAVAILARSSGYVLVRSDDNESPLSNAEESPTTNTEADL